MRKLKNITVQDVLWGLNACDDANDVPEKILKSRAWKKLFDSLPESFYAYQYSSQKYFGIEIENISELFDCYKYRGSSLYEKMPWEKFRKQLEKRVNTEYFNQYLIKNKQEFKDKQKLKPLVKQFLSIVDEMDQLTDWYRESNSGTPFVVDLVYGSVTLNYLDTKFE